MTQLNLAARQTFREADMGRQQCHTVKCQGGGNSTKQTYSVEQQQDVKNTVNYIVKNREIKKQRKRKERCRIYLHSFKKDTIQQEI